MACSQNDRTEKLLLAVSCWQLAIGLNADNFVTMDDEPRHLRLEMYLATTAQNGIAHVLDDLRQTVSTDMRMGIGQNGRRSSVLAKHVENLIDITALLGASVELAIRIGACTTLAKAVVTFAVNLLSTGNSCQVLLTVVNILSPFQHNRTQAQLYQSEGCKQTTRSGSYDNNLGTTAHIAILCVLIFIISRHLVDIDTNLQIDKDGALAGINAALQNTHTVASTNVESVLIGQPQLQLLLIGSHLRQYTNLVFAGHLR